MASLHLDGERAALRVVPLTADGAGEAFVLARHRLSTLAPDRWHDFLAAWEAGGPDRGLMAARNQRGALLAVAAWWRQPDLLRGNALWADLICVRELGVRPIVRAALIAGLERMADARGDRLRIASDACRGGKPGDTSTRHPAND